MPQLPSHELYLRLLEEALQGLDIGRREAGENTRSRIGRRQYGNTQSIESGAV